MKKNPYISLIAGGTAIIAMCMPFMAHAETVKERIKQNYQEYAENVKNNEDYRNAAMDKRVNATTTVRADRSMPLKANAELQADMTIKGDMRHSSSSMKRVASTTKVELRERMNEVRRDMFGAMHEHIVRQLTHSLDNLKQIRGRIDARVATSTANGKDMTSARAFLVTADAKIVIADQAIATVKAYVPATAASIDASASATVDLIKPRKLGADAISAVHDAREALSDVIGAIAKALRND